MNQTPTGNRIHIGFFGRRNAGKSSLVNAVTHQEIAVVSDTKGTTTDPVYKTMELLPLGAVMIIDTPGFDDEGMLGQLRIKKTRQVLNKTDIAVLVINGEEGITPQDEEMLSLFVEKEIPYLLAVNKMDVLPQPEVEKGISGFFAERGNNRERLDKQQERVCFVSAKEGTGILEFCEKLAHLVPVKEERFQIVGDLIQPMDTVVLVVPIDSSAPKGRLILPQQQVIRDILEVGAVSVVVRDTELKETLAKLSRPPALVITDSQVFRQVAEDTPENVFLTSFSILMARNKGFLETAVRGVNALQNIKDGDKILIAEGCTHHRQCEDIGTVKLPQWIREYTGSTPEYDFCSGTEFPEDLSAYKCIIHCGGCMLGEKELVYRMKCAIDQKVPFTNYGTAIAYMNGILRRSLLPIPGMVELLLL